MAFDSGFWAASRRPIGRRTSAMVTHPCTNRAQSCLTLISRRNHNNTTPHSQPHMWDQWLNKQIMSQYRRILRVFTRCVPGLYGFIYAELLQTLDPNFEVYWPTDTCVSKSYTYGRIALNYNDSSSFSFNLIRCHPFKLTIPVAIDHWMWRMNKLLDAVCTRSVIRSENTE